MVDKHGILLEKHLDVNVPKPNRTETHKKSFVGIIIDILESRGTAIVEDQCGEFFEIETDRLEMRNK